MPKFDGTGPSGYGPRTGRGLGGCCVGGFGRGYGRRFYSRKEEEEILQEEVGEMKKELMALEERLQELKNQK